MESGLKPKSCGTDAVTVRAQGVGKTGGRPLVEPRGQRRLFFLSVGIQTHASAAVILYRTAWPRPNHQLLALKGQGTPLTHWRVVSHHHSVEAVFLLPPLHFIWEGWVPERVEDVCQHWVCGPKPFVGCSRPCTSRAKLCPSCSLNLLQTTTVF